MRILLCFDIYFNFLTHHDAHTHIKQVNILLMCFNMESFFDDDTFLKYLITETHIYIYIYPVWNEFYSHIGELPDEREMYLYTPYQFVPDTYMNKPSFFNQWISINQNKNIILNNYEVYHTVVTYYDDHHNQNNQNKESDISYKSSSRSQ